MPDLAADTLSARHFAEPLGDGITLQMARIPAGTFLMGAPESEPGSRRSEQPQHRVAVAAFCLGRHAVTIAQWCAVMGTMPEGMTGIDAAFRASPQQPVVRVSCDDAEAFCRTLSRQTGRAYRLPSEAEWEHACRAGTTTPFGFGATMTRDVANHDGTSTLPVGGFAANGFGLLDMHGNVFEWCHERTSAYPETHVTRDTITADEIVSRGNPRILRGCSFNDLASDVRSADRIWLLPMYRNSNLGFRPARTYP